MAMSWPAVLTRPKQVQQIDQRIMLNVIQRDGRKTFKARLDGTSTAT